MISQGELTVSPTKSTSSRTFDSPEEFLIHLTEINRITKIQDYLEKHPEYDIIKVKSSRKYSLMHTACLNNQIKLCQLFFNHIKAQNASEGKVRVWLNSQTEEGFTPIHFASFKGNIELIKLLESHGADFAIKNNQGLSVAHIAAQGDQPVSLAYFREKGISIHERDNKGSTPLHWAAFLGMENATNFLTAWGCPVNEKDSESGFTSLHLGVLSGNARVVRRVLIKGADKNIKDKDGRLPITIASENGYENIIQLLKGKGWLIEFLNIKPSFKKKRTKRSLISFSLLYVAFNTVNILFVFPFVESSVWVILYSILILFTISMFLMAWLTDPGYISNPRKADVLNILINNEPNSICPECVIVKPPRSRHCEYCNQCVAVCDHHCPWIDNCVGARNHRYFICFTLSITLCLIFMVAFSIAHIGTSTPVFTFSNPAIYGSDQSLFVAKEFICSADLILGVMFIFPLLALNYVQVCNFMLGRTTNERFGFKGKKAQKDEHKASLLSTSTDAESIIVEPPRNAACLLNCSAMCYSNARDSRYQYQPLPPQPQLGL